MKDLAGAKGHNASSACRLGIVVPCYNEEEVLPETVKRLSDLLDRMVLAGQVQKSSRIYFVDDGSKDRTWAMVEELSQMNTYVAGIKLSRNRGHQNALLAGLFTAEGDVLVSVDADLQDDIEVIAEMVTHFASGVDIVYGVRDDRSRDSFFKRASALGFYRLMSKLGAESVYNHADFRLMSRRAVEALMQFREVNLFLRGMVPLVGFKSVVVKYNRSVRFAGVSKYPLRKMIALALDAVTSFSVIPLRLITLVGFSVFVLSCFVVLWTLWIRFLTARAVPGWASTTLPIYLLGGIQILCVGVIGEYLGKLYQEAKSRPRYIIEKMI
jgi:glycosyltransferase involved in cell wall biosynthesis